MASEKTFTISFSGEEYARLLELLYTGDWVKTAYNKEDESSSKDPLLSKLYSMAGQFGCGAMVAKDPAGSAWLPSETLEKQALPAIETYDDMSFWENLGHRLAERDFSQAVNAADAEKMSWEEKYVAKEKLREAYLAEFESAGLQRLKITKE